ncbi:MAG: Ig-like domain-containing protein [Thermoplasmata archaeon]
MRAQTGITAAVLLLNLISVISVEWAGSGGSDAAGPRATFSTDFSDSYGTYTMTVTFTEPAPVHNGNIIRMSGTFKVDKGFPLHELSLEIQNLTIPQSSFWYNVTGEKWSLEFRPLTSIYDTGFIKYRTINYKIKFSFITPQSAVYSAWLGPPGLVKDGNAAGWFTLDVSANDCPAIAHSCPEIIEWDPAWGDYHRLPISFTVRDNGYIKNVLVFEYSNISKRWQANRTWSSGLDPDPGSTGNVSFGGNLTAFFTYAQYTYAISLSRFEPAAYYVIAAGDCANCVTFSPVMPASFVEAALESTSFNGSEEWLASAYSVAHADQIPPTPLTIIHTPVKSMNVNEQRNLTADVFSETAPSVELVYRGVLDTEFTTVTMSLDGMSGNRYSFRASLPAQKELGELVYYIKATAGNSTAHDPPGAPGLVHRVQVVGKFWVASTYPADRDINLPADLSKTIRPSISITFSMAANASTVREGCIKAYYYKNIERTDRVDIDGLTSYDPARFTARFEPAGELPEGKRIHVTVSKSIQSTLGVALGSDYNFSFMTMPNITLRVVPVQVVEGCDLVQHKPTVVRVFPEWPADQCDVANVTASVRLRVDGVDQSCRQSALLRPMWSLSPRELAAGRASTDFDSELGEFSFYRVAGKHTVEAIVEPLTQHTQELKRFSNSTVTRVLPSKRLGYNIYYVPIRVGNYSLNQTQEIINFTSGWDSYVEKVFPVAWTNPTITSAFGYSPLDPRMNGLSAHVEELSALHYDCLLSDYERYVGVVPYDWLNEGQGWDGTRGLYEWKTWTAVLVEEPIPANWKVQTTDCAHELLHSYGLDHSETTHDIIGYDVSLHEPMSFYETPAHMLNNILRERPVNCDISWVRLKDYSVVLRALTTALGGRQGGGSENRSLLVSGFLGPGGGLQPLFSVDRPPEPGQLPPGNVTVLMLDATGTPLLTYALEPLELGSGRRYFAFRAAWPEGLSAVVLMDGASEISRISRSPSPPTLTVLSPAGAISGDVNISWSASDPDGDNLTFAVLWRPSGGLWLTLASGLKGTWLIVNTSGLRGGAGEFRVLASDGFNTVRAESPPVSLPGRPPAVFLQRPEPAAGPFETGDLISLVAFAYDPDDGPLTGKTIKWSSSASGALGTGQRLLVALPAGVHTITVVATDSDGNTAQASVRITVLGPGEMPPGPNPVYWVSLSSAKNRTSDGRVSLSWTGRFPERGELALYWDRGGSWELLKLFKGFDRCNYTVTGLSTTRKMTYRFYIALRAENGTELASSEAVTVTSVPAATPRGPRFIPEPAYLAPATLASGMALATINRRHGRPS